MFTHYICVLSLIAFAHICISTVAGESVLPIIGGIPTSRKNSPFFLGPLKIESELSSNGKYVQVQMSLDTVIVAATVFTADDEDDFVFDLLVGTAQAKGKLHSHFRFSGNETSKITAEIDLKSIDQSGHDLKSIDQSGHYEGEIFNWWQPEFPLPSKGPVAPNIGDYFYFGNLRISTTLQQSNKLHVVAVQAEITLAAFTISPSVDQTSVNVAIGGVSLQGSINMVYEKSGISTVNAVLTLNADGQSTQSFRGGIFYWSASSDIVENFQVPCIQPFYFGPAVIYTVELQKVDSWTSAKLSIYDGDMLATTHTFLPTSPLWNFNWLIGSTANNGSATAYFAPAGEISSVMIDSVLYQYDQVPVPYTGGVYFWIAN